MYHQLFVKNCSLPIDGIYKVCIYRIKNGEFCPILHKLIGFYNRDVKCLLRGTNWVFKYSSL